MRANPAASFAVDSWHRRDGHLHTSGCDIEPVCEQMDELQIDPLVAIKAVLDALPYGSTRVQQANALFEIRLIVRDTDTEIA